MESRLLAQLHPWSDFLEIAYLERNGREVRIGRIGVMEEVQDGMAIAEPTFRLSRTAGQELMDSLWQCGLRPSEGTGSAGSMAATQAHLQDMQKIAMGLLKKGGVDV